MGCASTAEPVKQAEPRTPEDKLMCCARLAQVMGICKGETAERCAAIGCASEKISDRCY